MSLVSIRAETRIIIGQLFCSESEKHLLLHHLSLCQPIDSNVDRTTSDNGLSLPYCLFVGMIVHSPCNSDAPHEMEAPHSNINSGLVA